MSFEAPWRFVLGWPEIHRGAQDIVLEPDEAQREALARALDVPAIYALRADLTVRPWVDGAEIDGRFEGEVTYVCGVTLDPFEAPVAGNIHVRVLPAGSRHAHVADNDETVVDLEADDPPDVVEGDGPDLAAYLSEHLSLALDPFPRKPDAVLETPEAGEATSPFAALSALLGKSAP